jgi:hypothetical protein
VALQIRRTRRVRPRPIGGLTGNGMPRWRQNRSARSCTLSRGRGPNHHALRPGGRHGGKRYGGHGFLGHCSARCRFCSPRMFGLARPLPTRHHANMTDTNTEKAQALREQLEAVYEKFNRTVGQPSDTWQFWRFKARMPSQRITAVFVGFCVATFLAGAIMTFFGPTKELGIAIVVGSIFTGGSFMIQYWAVQVTSERALYESLNAARHQDTVAKLASEINDLVGKLEKIDPNFRN